LPARPLYPKQLSTCCTAPWPWTWVRELPLDPVTIALQQEDVEIARLMEANRDAAN